MALVSIIAANIGSDAETRDVSDTTVTSFRCCDNTKRGDREVATWYAVNVWGRYGEALKPDLVKGARVSVSGELMERQYTDRDGNERTSLEVRAQHVHVERNAQGRPAGSGGGQVAEDDDVPF